MNCGNFLNSTDAQSCGVEVGYGKLYLIYAEKQTVNVSSLNATAINAAIAAGTIIGVLKDWDEVAGAPVAEVTAERPGSKKIRFISNEILADTITFDNSPCLNETLARLSRKGAAEVLLVDDNGNVYGEETYASATIGTMTVSFGSKTSTSLQSDNTNVNNLAITVRYLYKKLRAAAVGVPGTPLTNTSTSKSAVAISVANEPLQLSNALTVQTPAAAVVKSRKTTSYFDTIKS